MHCFVCAQRGAEHPAVGLCRHCLVGLCLRHLVEAQQPGPGGTQLGCRHASPAPEPVRENRCASDPGEVAEPNLLGSSASMRQRHVVTDRRGLPPYSSPPKHMAAPRPTV